MKHALITIVFSLLLGLFFVDATSPPHCFFEPSNHIFFPGQKYIHAKPNGWCYRRATCNNDYNTSIEECADFPCPADKWLNKSEFPDCCCGDVSH